MRNRFHNRPLPASIYMTDSSRSNPEKVIPKLPRHSIVILRDYNHPDRTLYISALATLARKCGHMVFVAGAPALAARLGADGIHLPEYMLPKLAGIKKRYPHLFLSVATHNYTSIIAANRGRADAALLSPLFITASHDGMRPLGLIRARLLKNNTLGLKTYALGGIKQSDIPALTSSKFYGFAGIGLFDTPNLLLHSNNHPQKARFNRHHSA